jgi:hypothetical protein
MSSNSTYYRSDRSIVFPSDDEDAYVAIASERDSIDLDAYYGDQDAIMDSLSSWSDRNKDTTVEAKFEQLVAVWKSETGMLSRLDQICMHPAYQRIIGMGPQVIPFILRDLKATQAYWFWALGAITGEDPVSNGENANMDQLAEAWLAWGRSQGYHI